MLKHLTQHQKILRLMSIRQDVNPNTWFRAYDFMQPDLPRYLFVGYEASARLSELRSDYGFLFESKRDGKYIITRLNMETIENNKDRLPDRLQDMLKEI